MHEDFSMDSPTQNMLQVFSSTWTIGALNGIVKAWIVRFNQSKIVTKKGMTYWTNQIQHWHKLHFHAPRNYSQHGRIWNNDLTLRATYCELDGPNQMFSNILEELPS